MNLQAILKEIKSSLHIYPYKGNVYIREGELEAILKIAYKQGKDSAKEETDTQKVVDDKKGKKV